MSRTLPSGVIIPASYAFLNSFSSVCPRGYRLTVPSFHTPMASRLFSRGAVESNMFDDTPSTSTWSLFAWASMPLSRRAFLRPSTGQVV